MNFYDTGNVVQVPFVFQREDTKEFYDPPVVTCFAKKPDGTQTAYVYGTDAEVTRQAVGQYTFNITIARAEGGQWSYRGEGTGGDDEPASFEDVFYAKPSMFP